MEELFEQIREQIHEIRNLIGPFDLKLANLEYRVAANWRLFQEKTTALESKVVANSVQVEEQNFKISSLFSEIAKLSERMTRFESSLNAQKNRAKE